MGNADPMKLQLYLQQLKFKKNLLRFYLCNGKLTLKIKTWNEDIEQNEWLSVDFGWEPHIIRNIFSIVTQYICIYLFIKIQTWDKNFMKQHLPSPWTIHSAIFFCNVFYFLSCPNPLNWYYYSLLGWYAMLSHFSRVRLCVTP